MEETTAHATPSPLERVTDEVIAHLTLMHEVHKLQPSESLDHPLGHWVLIGAKVITSEEAARQTDNAMFAIELEYADFIDLVLSKWARRHNLHAPLLPPEKAIFPLDEATDTTTEVYTDIKTMPLVAIGAHE